MPLEVSRSIRHLSKRHLPGGCVAAKARTSLPADIRKYKIIESGQMILCARSIMMAACSALTNPDHAEQDRPARLAGFFGETGSPARCQLREPTARKAGNTRRKTWIRRSDWKRHR